MSGQEDKSDRSGKYENDSVSLGAGESIIINSGVGTDTATNRYLNLPEGVSYGVEVLPTVACAITEINGVPLKVAIGVGTLGFITNHVRVTSVKIQAGSATVVQIGGKA